MNFELDKSLKFDTRFISFVQEKRSEFVKINLSQ